MSEEFHSQLPPISVEAARHWMADLNERAFGQQQIVFDRGNDPEQFVIEDALDIRVDRDDTSKGVFPGLVLRDTSGRIETIDTRTYLASIGFDAEAYEL